MILTQKVRNMKRMERALRRGYHLRIKASQSTPGGLINNRTLQDLGRISKRLLLRAQRLKWFTSDEIKHLSNYWGI